MLFFVEGLCVIDSNVGHQTQAASNFILTAGKYRVLVIIAATDNRLKGLLAKGHNGIKGSAYLQRSVGPFFAQKRNISAGNNVAVGVHNAKHTVCRVF